MHKGAFRLLTTIMLASQAIVPKAFADVSEPIEQPVEQTPEQSPEQAPEARVQPKVPQKPTTHAIKAFTGKVTKNKVRMRLQPSLDGPIIRELNRDDLLIVLGENDEFYAVQPPKDTKAYIFRTFVLDNVIEGNRVNVRLEPTLEAPVIAQLNTGDRVDGLVSPLNSKWLEIAPPESTRFFVCKEYVEKVGDPTLMSKIEKRREEVNNLLNSTYLLSQTELQKPYNEINLDTVISNFNKVTKQYADFPEQVSRAKEMLSNIQDTYLQKKIAYLEAKANSSGSTAHASEQEEGRNQQDRLKDIENQLKQQAAKTPAAEDATLSYKDGPDSALVKTSNLENQDWSKLFNPDSMTGKMATWIPTEKALYEAWVGQNGSADVNQFYKHQLDEVVKLTGIIEPYSRIVKNKPGDYILVNQSSSLPIAYLYSTLVNLQELAGREVTIKAVSRPNNNFAFPAYFVVELD